MSPIKCLLVVILCSAIGYTFAAEIRCDGNNKPKGPIGICDLKYIQNLTISTQRNLEFIFKQSFTKNETISKTLYETYKNSNLNLTHPHRSYTNDVIYTHMNESFHYNQLAEHKKDLDNDKSELFDFLDSIDILFNMTRVPELNHFDVNEKMANIYLNLSNTLQVICPTPSYEFNSNDVYLEYSIVLEAIKVVSYLNYRLDMMIGRKSDKYCH